MKKLENPNLKIKLDLKKFGQKVGFRKVRMKIWFDPNKDLGFSKNPYKITI